MKEGLAWLSVMVLTINWLYGVGRLSDPSEVASPSMKWGWGMILSPSPTAGCGGQRKYQVQVSSTGCDTQQTLSQLKSTFTAHSCPLGPAGL